MASDGPSQAVNHQAPAIGGGLRNRTRFIGLPRSGCERLCCASPVFKSESEQLWGCHDLGVCDKVVLKLVTSPFYNRSLRCRDEISLILNIDRRHGLVADSRTVAPIL